MRHSVEKFSKHRGNLVRQGLSIALACGLGALTLITNSNNKPKKYDTETETQLEGVIRPAMVRIAKEVVALKAEKPSKYPQGVGTGSSIKTGSSNMSMDVRESYYPGEYYSLRSGRTQLTGKRGQLRVVGERIPGTNKFDPESVKAVKIRTYPSPRENDFSGFLAAPGAEQRLETLGIDIVDTHTEGWTASSSGKSPSGDYLFDSSNPDFLITNPNGSDGTPLDTANFVVHSIERRAELIISGR